MDAAVNIEPRDSADLTTIRNSATADIHARMSYFRDQLEDWLKQIAVKADKVLDVGGSQNPVKGRTLSWDVKDYVIADLPTPHETKAEPTLKLDLNQWDKTKVMQLAETSADVVFCLEVMEYLWNPIAALANIKLAMKAGGRLYISFPFVYPMHNPIGCDFLRYTEEGARKLLEVSGFRIEEVRPRVARMPAALQAFYSSDGMHPRRDDTIKHTGYLIIANKP